MVNKAELRGYSEEPFFKTDKDYDQGRIIAWAGDVERQAQLFWSLAEALGERIDYLLKVELDVNEKASQWRRIFGNILLSDLKVAIKSHDELFFHDSGFQICLRKPDSGEYFAYDEHGIFWIYSNDECFIKILKESGLSEREAQLICDSSHWHIRPNNAEYRLEQFIQTLIKFSQYNECEDTG